MARRKLSVVAGDQSRSRKPKAAPPPNELANRWRELGPTEAKAQDAGDVIPILDGWVRRLERQAGLDSAANES
ncbi:MAG TPA: hypothetical protein VF483_05140 [Gemmatimonadaceae bacterium]